MFDDLTDLVLICYLRSLIIIPPNVFAMSYGRKRRASAPLRLLGRIPKILNVHFRPVAARSKSGEKWPFATVLSAIL